MFQNRTLSVLALVALAAGCTHPSLREGPVTPAPKVWDVSDYSAPNAVPAYIPADSITPLPWGRYPTAEEDIGRTAPGFVSPDTTWKWMDEIGTPLAYVGTAARVLAGLPAIGVRMEVRRAVWPRDAHVELRDSVSVVIASEWVSTDETVGELRCEPVDRWVSADVRMQARLERRGTEIEIISSFAARGATRCAGTPEAEDRLRDFSTDVLMALRSAARSVVPVPVRQ